MSQKTICDYCGGEILATDACVFSISTAGALNVSSASGVTPVASSQFYFDGISFPTF